MGEMPFLDIIAKKSADRIELEWNSNTALGAVVCDSQSIELLFTGF